MRRLTLCVPALLLALPSCVSNQLPVPRIAVPAGFDAPQMASGSPALIEQWWQLFGDVQLTNLVDTALSSAPDATTALARLREAQAVRRGALTAYDPQGNLSGAIGRSDTHVNGLSPAEVEALGAGKATTANAAFDVSWEIDLFGRRAAARRTANADLAGARFDYAGTRISLAASVAQELFEARGLSAQIVEAAETVRIERDLAHVGRLRVTSGLGSDADAARLDTTLATAQSDLVNLQAQLKTSRRSLLVLLGRGTDALDTLPIAPIQPTPPRPPAFTPTAVMERRPDVAEAEQQLLSSAGALRLDQLALFPRLTLQPGASITKLLGPAGYTETAWSVAAGLFVPVLDRARLLSEIGAQTARGDQSVIAYEHIVQSAFGEAENSLTTLSADFERLDRLTFAEKRANFAFSAEQQGYKAGIVDLDSLLQTEQTWRSARIALITLRTATLNDAVTSFKALGGGWSPDTIPGS